MQVAFVRLLAVALLVVSAGCGSANEPQFAAPAPSEITAQVMLPTVKELYRPIAGEGALWLRDVDTGTVSRIDPLMNTLAAQLAVGPWLLPCGGSGGQCGRQASRRASC